MNKPRKQFKSTNLELLPQFLLSMTTPFPFLSVNLHMLILTTTWWDREKTSIEIGQIICSEQEEVWGHPFMNKVLKICLHQKAQHLLIKKQKSQSITSLTQNLENKLELLIEFPNKFPTRHTSKLHTTLNRTRHHFWIHSTITPKCSQVFKTLTMEDTQCQDYPQFL